MSVCHKSESPIESHTWNIVLVAYNECGKNHPRVGSTSERSSDKKGMVAGRSFTRALGLPHATDIRTSISRLSGNSPGLGARLGLLMPQTHGLWPLP